MKKTLLVTLDFYPSIGGVSGYWMQLAKALSSHDFVVVAPPLPKGSSKLSVPYRIIRTGFLSQWANPAWVLLVKNLWGIIRTERPQVIIVGQILPVGTAVWILSYFLKIPYIVSCHGMDILQQKNPRKRWLMKKILARASGAIANSKYTARALQSLGVASEKISYVYPCPVNVPVMSEQRPVSKNGHTLLTVCRLVPRKGHEYVLRALPEVLKKYPDTQYVIIGDGSYRKELEKLVETLGLRASVRFMGALVDEEVRMWYGQADIFIMPTVDIAGDVEGFGIVYLEAGAFGVPVIASAVGGVEEAVLNGKTGVVVPQKDVSGITQAIIRLFDNPHIAQHLGQAGKERVHREFQWDTQARNLTHAIDRCI